MIIKAKIKNIKIESIVAKQFEIDIEREKRNIKFLITSPVEEEIVKYCFEKGLVLTGGVLGSADGISGDALQIAPPFIIEEEQMDWTISLIAEAIEMIMKQRAE